MRAPTPIPVAAPPLSWPAENPFIPSIFLRDRLPWFVAGPAGVVAWALPKQTLPCGDHLDHQAAIGVRLLWWKLRVAIIDRWGVRCPYGGMPIAVCRDGYEEAGWESCACLDYGDDG